MIIVILITLVLLLFISIASSSDNDAEEGSYSYGYYFPPGPVFSSTPYSMLPINCTKQGFGSVKNKVLCQQYIKNWIMAYTGNMEGSTGYPNDMPNQSYNNLQIPYDYDPLTELHPVYIELELSDLVNIDTQNGIIYVTAYLSLLWKDYRFQWDMEYANISKTYVHSDWIWNPDITLYNQASDSIIQDAPVMVYSNGQIYWKRISFLASYCQMNIQAFPFDVQTCTLDFASWAGHLNITASPKQIKHPIKNNLISPQFASSISYSLESFTVQNSLKNEGGVEHNWPFVQYTIVARRNSGFYESTIIYPILIIAVIAGLFIPDINSRLGLSVTAILTVMAIMWSVTSSLPVSNCSTWIQEFSFFQTILIACCCLENAVVAYLQSKSGLPPKWVEHFIEASNIFSRIYDHFYFFFVDHCCDCFCKFYTLFWYVRKSHRRKIVDNNIHLNHHHHQSSGNDDIEMNDINNDDYNRKKYDSDDEDNDNNNNNTNTIINDDNSINNNNDDDRITITPITMNPLNNNKNDDNNKNDNNDNTDNIDNKNDDNNNNDVNDNEANDNEILPLLESKKVKELSWERVGHGFDRLMRFVLPLTLLIGTCRYYALAINPVTNDVCNIKHK